MINWLRSIIFTLVPSWKNSSLTVSKTNLFAIAVSTTLHCYWISVQNELSCLAIWKRNVVSSSPVQLQQTAKLLLLRAADSSWTQHISNLHVAAGKSMVRQLLSTAPVHILVISLYQLFGLLHFWSFVKEAQLDVIRHMICFFQVRERSRILLVKFDLASFECLESDDPRRDSWNSIFGSEWTEWDILPDLEISETPVIKKDETKNILPSLINFDRFS